MKQYTVTFDGKTTEYGTLAEVCYTVSLYNLKHYACVVHSPIGESLPAKVLAKVPAILCDDCGVYSLGYGCQREFCDSYKVQL